MYKRQLLPLSKDARKYFKKKLGDDYEIYIGMDEALCPVSYTHLDVYKRQVYHRELFISC